MAIDLDIKKELKVTRAFSLKPSTVDLIEELAELYGTNASRVVETMATQYGAKLLEQKRKDARA